MPQKVTEEAEGEEDHGYLEMPRDRLTAGREDPERGEVAAHHEGAEYQDLLERSQTRAEQKHDEPALQDHQPYLGEQVDEQPHEGCGSGRRHEQEMRIETQSRVPAQGKDAPQEAPHCEHRRQGKQPLSPGDRNHSLYDEREARDERNHEPNSAAKDPLPLDRAWVLGCIGCSQLSVDGGGLACRHQPVLHGQVVSPRLDI